MPSQAMSMRHVLPMVYVCVGVNERVCLHVFGYI